jgi:CheY-like chemotaxis protein
MKILLVDSQPSTYDALQRLCNDCDIERTASAHAALTLTHNALPNVIVLEIALAGHSGLEFLYELRTYTDWLEIPVIVYSRIRLPDEVLSAPAWQQLNVVSVLYKPADSVHTLLQIITKYCTTT